MRLPIRYSLRNVHNLLSSLRLLQGSKSCPFLLVLFHDESAIQGHKYDCDRSEQPDPHQNERKHTPRLGRLSHEIEPFWNLIDVLSITKIFVANTNLELCISFLVPLPYAAVVTKVCFPSGSSTNLTHHTPFDLHRLTFVIQVFRSHDETNRISCREDKC
jgi:hypothetical protein